MQYGILLVAGNGDLKYPGYSSYLAAKITSLHIVALLPGGKTNTAASSYLLPGKTRWKPMIWPSYVENSTRAA